MAEGAREVVQREVPELSSFVHMTHTEFSELYLTGNVVLQSEVGLQQGLGNPQKYKPTVPVPNQFPPIFPKTFV